MASSLLLFLSLLFISSTICHSFTLPLTHFQPNPSQDPSQKLSHLASTSLTRAKHLKNPHFTPTHTPTPLSPHSYGGYSISLSFGTPPQTIPFIMDTGSDFVWFPCTHRYICRNCTGGSGATAVNRPPPTVPSFIPRQSASARVLGCLNPKCGLIHGNYNVQSRCQDCSPTSYRNCRQECPPYLILYGSGSTGGIALVETLDLPGGRRVANFVVGCSLFSSHQPAGIAGFGRGPSSLPSQLGLTKFSYCLLSHLFDNSDKSSPMVLDTSTISSVGNLSYTPFIKNPVIGKHAFSVYYYVGLRKITIGGQKVKIPFSYLLPGSDGNGGTIIDSGSTFTYMNYNVFKLVMNAFIEQVSYRRAEHVEIQTGLRPCFTITSRKKLSLPEMRLHFKGGAEMALPLANYFSFAGNLDTVCLTMVTDSEPGTVAAGGGPAIILGNYQLQNFYTEFDLRKERFGFRPQSCRRQ